MDDQLCMLPYYKKHICQLHEMLKGLDPESTDMKPLLGIQNYLISRIIDTERKLFRSKTQLGQFKSDLRRRGNSKLESHSLKNSITTLNRRVLGYKFLLYTWRCFGDGIACKYISKWNLKRFLYEGSSPDVKQKSGNIGGKEGFKPELELMNNALANGVPAVLCDLTNILRHGDLCLLGDNDPVVIEVKSSQNTNRRTERQYEELQKIDNYLNNDFGDVGGFRHMRRETLESDERNYFGQINQIANAALAGGTHYISPEAGIHYFAVHTGAKYDFGEELSEIGEPILFMLNEKKTNQQWDNFYPFVLSILNSSTLYAFLTGRIYLFVVLDGASIKYATESLGYASTIALDNDYVLSLDKLDDKGMSLGTFALSYHIFSRVAFDFTSFDWLIRTQIQMNERLIESIESGEISA